MTNINNIYIIIPRQVRLLVVYICAEIRVIIYIMQYMCMVTTHLQYSRYTQINLTLVTDGYVAVKLGKQE